MDMQFLETEWAYFTGALVTLFFIIDPFAAVPIYVTLTDRFSKEDRKAIRIKAVLVALGLLVFFAVSGMRFFSLFGITLPAFQIAGGILLLILGLSQLNASGKKVSSAEADEGLHKDDISVFPLAMPILAGPGAISTVILLSTEAGSFLRLVELVIAIALCLLGTLLIMRSSQYLVRVLGTTGLTLFSRIMGIVLTAIAVQFVLNGVGEAMKRLH
jgi:multiple antibiotic resistance protein